MGIVKLDSTPFLPLTLPGTSKLRSRMSMWFISRSLPFPILMGNLALNGLSMNGSLGWYRRRWNDKVCPATCILYMRDYFQRDPCNTHITLMNQWVFTGITKSMGVGLLTREVMTPPKNILTTKTCAPISGNPRKTADWSSLNNLRAAP